jgi:hypothetical protein
MTQLRTCLNFATARTLTEAAVAVGRTIDNCVQTFIYMIQLVFVSASNRFYRANIKELPMTIARGFPFVYCTLVQYHPTWICEIGISKSERNDVAVGCRGEKSRVYSFLDTVFSLAPCP